MLLIEEYQKRSTLPDTLLMLCGGGSDFMSSPRKVPLAIPAMGQSRYRSIHRQALDDGRTHTLQQCTAALQQPFKSKIQQRSSRFLLGKLVRLCLECMAEATAHQKA